MDKIIAILIVIALLIIGRFRISNKVKKIQERIVLSDEYLDKLKDYLNSFGKDQKTYSWLIQMSHPIQLEMNYYGVIPSLYHQPSRTSLSNYQIIINGIPELRRLFENQNLPSDTAFLRDFGQTLVESILRHRGFLLNKLTLIEKNLRKPATWFAQGISWVLLLLPSFFEQIGIINKASLDRFEEKPLFKLFSSIVSLIELTGTIMTIVMGWEDFLKIISKIVSR